MPSIAPWRTDPPHLTGDLAYRIVIKAEVMKVHPKSLGGKAGDQLLDGSLRPRRLLFLTTRWPLQHRPDLPRQLAHDGEHSESRPTRNARVLCRIGYEIEDATRHGTGDDEVEVAEWRGNGQLEPLEWEVRFAR